MGVPEQQLSNSNYYLGDPLDNLAVLFQAQAALIEAAKLNGGVPSFRMGLFFADILDCFGLLDFENLCKVIGDKNALKIWDEVKRNGSENQSDRVF